MDHIDTHLITASQNMKYSPAIRASLALGKAHLNKYYNMTDHSEVYCIAMSEFLLLYSILISNNFNQQSYTHVTNFSISETSSGMTSGSPLLSALFVMSSCEHMQTLLLMKLSLLVWQMYRFSFYLYIDTQEPSLRLPNLSNRTFSMTYLLSQLLLLSCSRMSFNITLAIPLRMSRIHWSGGSITGPSIPDSLGWHWTSCYAYGLLPHVHTLCPVFFFHSLSI